MNQPPPPDRQPRAMWIVLALVAAAVVVAGGIVAVVMSGESDEMPAATTHTELPAPVLITATTAPKLTRTATVTPSPDFPTGLDPRCSQAPADLVEKISAKLNDPNHRVAHAVLLTPATGTPYIGASIVAADGLMIEKSDVWVQTKSRGMTAATAGARRNTDLPKTTDVLDIDLSGEEVQTVDMCAWKWAKASGYN